MRTGRLFGAFNDFFAGRHFELEIRVAIFALQYPRSTVYIFIPPFRRADSDFRTL
jgi:hypothetical protein